MSRKINLVDTTGVQTSESKTRTAADYPWADGMVAVIKKTVPKVKLDDLYDGDGAELVGPGEDDGKNLAVKIANALRSAGFEVKHGFDEFTNEIYAINAKGDKNHIVISETAETFEDGSWIIMLYGTEKIEWSSHSSSAPVLHDFVSESAKAPTKAQLAKAKKVLTSAKNSARAGKRAAVKVKFDAFQKKRAELDAEVKTAQDSMDHASQALADYDEHVRKERRSLEALENKASEAYEKAKAKRKKALNPLAVKVAAADEAYQQEAGKSALSAKAKEFVGRLASDAAKKTKQFGKGFASGPGYPNRKKLKKSKSRPAQ